MIVPLTVRGRTLGAITFVSAESGHHYDAADLDLAQNLARPPRLPSTMPVSTARYSG